MRSSWVTVIPESSQTSKRWAGADRAGGWAASSGAMTSTRWAAVAAHLDRHAERVHGPAVDRERPSQEATSPVRSPERSTRRLVARETAEELLQCQQIALDVVDLATEQRAQLDRRRRGGRRSDHDGRGRTLRRRRRGPAPQSPGRGPRWCRARGRPRWTRGAPARSSFDQPRRPRVQRRTLRRRGRSWQRSPANCPRSSSASSATVLGVSSSRQMTSPGASRKTGSAAAAPSPRPRPRSSASAPPGPGRC